MMCKKDPKCKCCLFFFWGLLISVVILTSFSNYSRRFYLYLYSSWRFMICCWFQMKLQIWRVWLWTRFCLFIYLFSSCFLFFFFCWNVLWRKRVLPPVSVLKWLPLLPNTFLEPYCLYQSRCWPTRYEVLSTRSKVLESALDEKTLKVFMNFMSQAKVENDMQFCLNPYEYGMFCWIYLLLGYIKLKCSLMKCPHSCPACEWQQILMQEFGTSQVKSPSRLTFHIGRWGRSHGLRC